MYGEERRGDERRQLSHAHLDGKPIDQPDDHRVEEEVKGVVPRGPVAKEPHRQKVGKGLHGAPAAFLEAVEVELGMKDQGDMLGVAKLRGVEDEPPIIPDEIVPKGPRECGHRQDKTDTESARLSTATPQHITPAILVGYQSIVKVIYFATSRSDVASLGQRWIVPRFYPSLRTRQERIIACGGPWERL